jgi:hypothetical protein
MGMESYTETGRCLRPVLRHTTLAMTADVYSDLELEDDEEMRVLPPLALQAPAQSSEQVRSSSSTG